MTDIPQSPLLCGDCRVPVRGREDEAGNVTVRCPDCGRTATLDEASRSAAEHKIDGLVGDMFSGLGRSSPNLTITKTSSPKSYPFITAD